MVKIEAKGLPIAAREEKTWVNPLTTWG